MGRTILIRRAALFGAIALLPLLALLPAGSAEAEARFYETTVLEDAEEDYAGNGALDIEAIHVGEKSQYNTTTASAKRTFNVRLDLRNRDEITTFQGQLPIEFELRYTAGGQEVVHNLTLRQQCQAGANGFVCQAPHVVPAGHSTDPSGVTFNLDSGLENLAVGATITNVWAASITNVAGNKVYEDVLPQDNANQPQGAEPTVTDGGTYTLMGTYPFLTATAAGSLDRLVTIGGETDVVVRFQVTSDIPTADTDTLAVRYDTPPGWSAKSNVVGTVAVPGGASAEMAITITAPSAAILGQRALVTINAYLVEAGGHAAVPVNLTVSEPRVELPEYDFVLTTPGPFTSGETATLTTTITANGTALERFDVAYEFTLNGRSKPLVTASEPTAGNYQVQYSFPESGDWTVDVFVRELSPSPHKAFAVKVEGEGGGFLPGFEVGFVVLALGLLVLRRR